MRSAQPVAIEEGQEKRAPPQEPRAPVAPEPDELVDLSSDMIIPLQWDGYDAFCLVILIFFGIFSRFWVIQYPRHYVYQEDKYIAYIDSYMNGSFFVDSQPPLAIEIMAYIAHLQDYQLTYQPPSSEPNFTYPTMEYVGLRSTPAFFSTILIPLMFFTVRLFGGSRFAAFSAGLFTICDFLLISMGRHVFIDGIVQFCIGGFLFCTAFLPHFTKRSVSWYIFMLLQSVFAGLSISTTFSALPIILFSIVFNVLTKNGLISVVSNVIISLIIFVLSFVIHVLLLPYHSTLDGFATESCRSMLVGREVPWSVNYSTIIPRTFETIISTILLYSKRTSPTPDWYNWPFITGKWTLLWTQLGRYVACFGNPATWWAIGISVAIAICKSCWMQRIDNWASFMAIGYCALLLGFAFGSSERGICDYEVPLIFGIGCLSLFIDEELPPAASGFVFSAISMADVFIFILWAPLVFGYQDFDQRFWPFFGHN